MPSWPIHLAMANRLKKKFNFNDDFVIGNVLPDVLNGYIIENPSKVVDSFKTHSSSFILDSLDNMVRVGYLVHIYTDNYFNDYFYRNHILIKDDLKYVIFNDGSLFYDVNIKSYRPKQWDFAMYGNKLCDEGLLGDLVCGSDLLYELAREFNITGDDLDKAIIEINSLIGSKPLYDKNEYKVFTEEELDLLFDGCYDYLCLLLEKFI